MTDVAVDEQRRRLRASVKPNESLLTVYAFSSYSPRIVGWAAARGLTPNQVTTVSLAIALVAAGAFSVGSRPGLVAGAVLLQVSLLADVVDGQLARYTGQLSPFGGWLDATFDRVKEYAVFAGLALGASRAGDDVWLLAAAALTLQTVRHMVLSSYNARENAEPSAPPPGNWSWPRRVVHAVLLPIAERYAVISVTAALAGARMTFVVLLIWGGLGLAYHALGRIVRSLA